MTAPEIRREKYNGAVRGEHGIADEPGILRGVLLAVSPEGVAGRTTMEDPSP